jgi:hypothetical protein
LRGGGPELLRETANVFIGQASEDYIELLLQAPCSFGSTLFPHFVVNKT